MEENLDLVAYFNVIRKRWLLVAALPLIAALTSAIISFFILKPVYQASTTLVVGKKAEATNQQPSQLLDYNVLLANQQLAKTYETIAKSRTVEAAVISQLGLGLKQEEFDQKVTVNSVKNTEVLEIDVTDNNPQLAAKIADTLADKFSQAVIQIKKVDSVSIVDKAAVPDKPIKPKKALNVLIAFVVGLMVSIGIAFLLEYLDNTVKDAKDVESALGLPVLGSIPYYDVDEV